MDEARCASSAQSLFFCDDRPGQGLDEPVNTMKVGHMKKIISFLILAALLASSAAALAQEILYTGAVTKAMTVREKKSTSARKLESVEAGEFINIIEYDDQWTKVEKNGKVENAKALLKALC